MTNQDKARKAFKAYKELIASGKANLIMGEHELLLSIMHKEGLNFSETADLMDTLPESPLKSDY